MNYEVTSDGKVLQNGIQIHQNTNNGYKTVFINKKYYRVHRLVAEKFIPNPDKKPNVNHKNGIKDDNRMENLEWVTQKENVHHYYNVLNGKKPNGQPQKLNQKQKIEVIDFIKDGMSYKKIAEKYNVSTMTICRIKKYNKLKTQ